jgi:hypothetical protein
MREMNTSMSVGGQEIRFSREATEELYRTTIIEAGADSCSCANCRNFAQQRGTIYAPEFTTLLVDLGADPCKELGVFELGPSFALPKSRQYGGWFVYCGELVQQVNARPETPFSFCFTISIPRGGLPLDKGLCCVEFLAELPWILPEQIDWLRAIRLRNRRSFRALGELSPIRQLLRSLTLCRTLSRGQAPAKFPALPKTARIGENKVRWRNGCKLCRAELALAWRWRL